MLLTAVLLGIASYLLEMAAGAKLKPLRHLASSSVVGNIGVSIGFTWALSMLFGASGVTVLTASILSTLLSLITYRLIGAVHSAKSYKLTRRGRIRRRTTIPS